MKKIFSLSSIILIIDIIIKIIVKTNIKLNYSIPIINNFFQLTYVKNEGAAWSILIGKTNFLIIITILFLAFFIRYIIKENNYKKQETLSYSLILSGTISNLIDRVIYGYIVDYIDINILNYNFPIFNISDACIVIGIMLLLFIKR